MEQHYYNNGQCGEQYNEHYTEQHREQPPRQQRQSKHYQYAIEYIRNGFWLGRFRKKEIENTINKYTSRGWRVHSMTFHPSISYLIFLRFGTIITFEKEVK